MNIDKLLQFESDQQLKDVDFIVDHNLESKEFKIVFTDGSASWITIMNQANKHVLKYFERRKINCKIDTFDAFEGNWMNLQWEAEDDEFVDND